jgi:hypothetical protein
MSSSYALAESSSESITVRARRERSSRVFNTNHQGIQAFASDAIRRRARHWYRLRHLANTIQCGGLIYRQKRQPRWRTTPQSYPRQVGRAPMYVPRYNRGLGGGPRPFGNGWRRRKGACRSFRGIDAAKTPFSDTRSSGGDKQIHPRRRPKSLV